MCIRDRPSPDSSRLPLTLRHLGHELVEPLRRKVERLSCFGARVCGHEDLHHLEAVLERQPRLLLALEDAHKMAILGLVAVGHRLSLIHISEPTRLLSISY